MKYNRMSPLLEGISEVEFNNLSPAVSALEKSYSRGATIFRFGENKKLIGFIAEGSAKIIKVDENGNQSMLEKLKGGSIFGDSLAFVGRESDFIAVLAESKCSVVFISYPEIVKGCTSHCDCRHKFLMNLFGLVCKKTAELSERIEIISNRSIRDKLLCYFSVAKVKQNSKIVKLEMSLSALSEYLCVDRTAMMREIKNMKDDGILEIKDKKVTIYID